ncbi:aryl-sulfate sulfotransferase [Sorangium sp. So ce406]|uniref:aryl-sulfate sulfotransferase n=1 Tax=Sorangium sp. So ce406 TaxID=3133311 RepID=UPI003F5BE263
MRADAAVMVDCLFQVGGCGAPASAEALSDHGVERVEEVNPRCISAPGGGPSASAVCAGELRCCPAAYTIFQAAGLGALLIDMNGREVQLWKGLHGFPTKLLPGGQVFGSTGERNPQHGTQDQIDLVQVDWEGNVVWRFDRLEHIHDPGEATRWFMRQHHDFQRQGNPVGYHAPGQEPLVDRGSTFLLVHENVRNIAISEHPLLDDKIIEVDWKGNIVWQWRAHEHVEELGFDDAARAALRRDPNLRAPGAGALGATPERRLGWIIGQHHAHIIPRGLPGEGNLLVFDNGGWAGYGAPNPGAPRGLKTALRDHSRVLEIDPITLEIRWQYTPREAGFVMPLDASRFYSPFISSAQRLPNGNTLITEGSDGRIFEVTPEHEIVWEYISPYWRKPPLSLNLVYRAYRAPYAWVPQLPAPREAPVPRLDITTFRVPGAAPLGRDRVVELRDAQGYAAEADFCVAPAEGSGTTRA